MHLGRVGDPLADCGVEKLENLGDVARSHLLSAGLSLSLHTGAESYMYHCTVLASIFHSFDFQLHMCMWLFTLARAPCSPMLSASLRTDRRARIAYDAAADARSSPGKAGSCVKWSVIVRARQTCDNFLGRHAQR